MSDLIICMSAVLALCVVLGVAWWWYMPEEEPEYDPWYTRGDLEPIPDYPPAEWEEEPDEYWVEDLPPERELEPVPPYSVDVPVRPEYLALSDDPELIVWDARRQAERCWEIVHVEFPRLRASILEQYRLAAAA